jgi:hypothetical protein
VIRIVVAGQAKASGGLAVIGAAPAGFAAKTVPAWK